MPTKKITDLFAERVKPPAKGRIEFFDAAFGSLALRVTESGISHGRCFIEPAAVCGALRWGIIPH